MKTDDNLSPFFKINYFLDINKSQDFNTQSIKIFTNYKNNYINIDKKVLQEYNTLVSAAVWSSPQQI